MMETSNTASPQHGHGEQAPKQVWETFRDKSYYDLWLVRIVGERRFGHGFHLVSRDGAAVLRDMLNEMLAAMKAARDQTLMVQHSQETRLNDIYDILEAAIAKATGAA